MTSRERPAALVVAARLVSFAVVCGILYFGQVILVPLALATLISLLLGPVVTRLQRWGLPRTLAVAVVMGLTSGLVAGVGWVVVGQLGEFAEELPSYRQNIRTKIAGVRAWLKGGTLKEVQTTIESIGKDMERDAGQDGDAEGPAPLPVRIESQHELLSAEFFGVALLHLATAGLVLLLSILMLLKREDLRNRIVSLAGQTSLAVTTKAFAEAGRSISRYLMAQFLINVTMGVAVWLGLTLIGVPYSALWGLVAAVFRYVPYVGPWVAALLPIAVSAGTSPGWSEVTLVVGMFVVLELLSNNVMEPWLYGQSGGISATAVIVATIFWTWLWGPVGLVLATPITSCLVVLGRYVPGLVMFERLLAAGPAPLRSHLRLYQRLLARDEDESVQILEEYQAEHTPGETCDRLLVPLLLALKSDAVAGRITSEDRALVDSALEQLLEEVLPSRTGAKEDPADEPRARILGVAVRGEYDELALRLLRLLLHGQSFELEFRSRKELAAGLPARPPVAVCVASLPPGDFWATRETCRNIQEHLGDVPVIVARLGHREEDPTRSRERLRLAEPQRVVYSLEELRDALLPLLRSVPRAPQNPTPSPVPGP